MKLRLWISAVALAMSAGAYAQTVQVQTSSPVLDVQRLAPQLLAFAGGDVNFANLVNGLALGLPVTLTTPVGPGVMQIVNFTPIGTMSALQIAQTLETARQALISRGIATPTAQQIGATLIGGLLPTALGNVQVTGLVRANGTLGASIVTQPSAAATLQAGSAAAGGTTRRNTSGTPSIPRPGYNCWTVARAERVALLVDAADYFKAFYEAALRAKRSITILGWDFNSQTRLHFDPLEPRINPNAPPALLGEFLNWLVQRRSSLHVHVLNWDYPMVFGTDREFPPLYGFGWTPARRVHLRYDDTHPVGGSHHQKVVLIDDTLAFLGGIDLTVPRWDTPRQT